MAADNKISKTSEKVRRSGSSNLIPGYKPPKKKKELITRCQDLTDACVDVLEKVMQGVEEKAADRISAASLILAYGHGKPKQQTEVTGADGEALVIKVSIKDADD